MIERYLLRPATTIGAGTIPGVNDLTTKAALREPPGHQYRLIDMRCHSGQFLQPDASADADGALNHRDDLMPAALRHLKGDSAQ